MQGRGFTTLPLSSSVRSEPWTVTVYAQKTFGDAEIPRCVLLAPPHDAHREVYGERNRAPSACDPATYVREDIDSGAA